MSWIDEAIEEAELIRISNLRKMETNHDVSQKNQELEIDLKKERATFLEALARETPIEKIINKIKEEGLNVEPFVGFIEGGGDLYGYVDSYAHPDGDYGFSTSSTSYGFGKQWCITVPPSTHKMFIVLTFSACFGRKKVNDSWFRSHEEIDYSNIVGYKPKVFISYPEYAHSKKWLAKNSGLVTLNQIEGQVKAWLVKIYSEQK